MKKVAYEPHRRLATKAVPSGTDYDRRDNRAAIEAEIAQERDNTFYTPTPEEVKDTFFPEDDIATQCDFLESLYERGIILDA